MSTSSNWDNKEKAYRVLGKQVYKTGAYSLVPIRHEDRYLIMKWRNEQIYHLRQNKFLTEAEQDAYFSGVVSALFEQEQPDQVLFSLLKNEVCIAYGGLVHINWMDQHAEISFLMDTALEKNEFGFLWKTFLGMIEELAFTELSLHKIYTYAYNLRPKLFDILVDMNYKQEAILAEHTLFENKYIDVLIHSKIQSGLILRKAKFFDSGLTYLWASDKSVRRYAFYQKPISLSEHNAWFKTKIEDPNCIYYILSLNGAHLGSIRFDIDETQNAMISYLVDPRYQGKGYGRALIKMGEEKVVAERADIKMIYGLVKAENEVSRIIFQKCGYEEELLENGVYRYTKN